MMCAPCRLAASGKRLRCVATPRQPSSALNKPLDGCLQLWRVVAHVAGFPERLINDGVSAMTLRTNSRRSAFVSGSCGSARSSIRIIDS